MTSQNQPVPTPMPIAAPRKRRWPQILLATGLLLAGSYWYSHLLRPEERRMVGMWQVSERSGPFDSTAFDFQADRTSSSFSPIYFTGTGLHPGDSDILSEHSPGLQWRRRGDFVTLWHHPTNFQNRLGLVFTIADGLWRGLGWRDGAMRFRVLREATDEMVLKGIHGAASEEIHLRLLTTVDEKERIQSTDGSARFKRILNIPSERASSLNAP